MDAIQPDTLWTLLARCGVAGIELDAGLHVRSVHNTELLQSLLGTLPEPGTGERMVIGKLLEPLFSPQHIQQIVQKLGAAHAPETPQAVDIGVLPGRSLRNAVAQQLAVSLHRLDHASHDALLVLRDVSETSALELALADARASYEAALTVLSAPSDALRLFLESAMASVGAIRATLRIPARTQDALREKLTRMHAETGALGSEALGVGMTSAASASVVLTDAITRLLQKELISGDDLLPLALHIDALASAIGRAWRIEEQRPAPPTASTTATVPTRRRGEKQASWREASERRWSEFLRHRGEEIGTLARLTMTGTDLVPAPLRRHVDEMLQHLLRNALEHGIETPEKRLAAGKPAAGHVTVKFEESDSGLKMTVHDDGQGFDLERIGRAAVKCGLITEESLPERDAGNMVGFIFKPSFTTTGLAGEEGRGRGMAYLRKAVTRLNGRINVATKPGRYTLFTIQLPAVASASHTDEPARAVSS